MKTFYNANGTPINLLQDIDIESENNRYIKLSNGTLICYGIIRITVSEDGTTSGNTTIYFEKQFTSTPLICLTNIFSWASDVIWSIGSGGGDSLQVYFRKISDSYKKGNTVDAHYIAIGKWK